MRIKVLDGLRGFAVLLVIFSHMPQIIEIPLDPNTYTTFQAFNFGYLGVDIFLVLSGFLITRILIKEKKEGTLSLKIFFIKRAFRILPIYLLTVLVCGFIFSWEGTLNLLTYTANYYFAFNADMHYLENAWSLSVEEHYYFIWPLVVVYFSLESVRRYSWLIAFTIALSATILVYQFFDLKVARSLIYTGTEFKIFVLSLGSTMAFYENQIMNWKRKIAIPTSFTSFNVFLALAFASEFDYFEDIAPSDALRGLTNALCALTLIVLALLAENTNSLFKTLFDNKVIAYIGKISYGLYLYHFPIFFGWCMLTNQNIGSPVSFLSFAPPLFLTFILAALSFKYIEQPLLSYKNIFLQNYRAKIILVRN